MAEHVEPMISTEHSELSDRDMQRAIAFMRAVWKLGACRTCGAAHYELMAVVVLRPVASINTLSDSKAHRRPTASLTCNMCGEVRFLDLAVAKIVAPSPGNPEGPREQGPSGGPFR
jgi:ribosomal protein L34E